MSSGALHMLGWRMARRNNLYTFAWVCALLLPPGMQLIAWFNDDVRDYLGGYFGPFTLYFFFVMTYGFGVIFVAYYQLSGYRKAGTLDLLRVSTLTPAEVLSGIYWQLQKILVPPIGGFGVVFAVYLAVSPERQMVTELGWVTILGGIGNVVLTQALLCAILCLGLLRGEAALSAVAALLLLPLNILPIALMFWAEGVRERWANLLEHGMAERMPLLLDWLTTAPWLTYVVLLGGVIALTMLAARLRLAALWPPQVLPPKGS